MPDSNPKSREVVPPEDPARPSLGRLGRYELVQEIGRGGMGVVYKALELPRKESESKPRWVALKTLPRSEAEDIFRLKQEFRSLADVTHTNLVSLLELATDGNQWFFTMEFVDGIDFCEYVRTQLGQTWDPAWETPTLICSTEERQAEPVSDEPRKEPPPLSTLAPPRNLTEPFHKIRLALSQLAQGIAALHEAGKLHRDIKPSNVLVTAEGRVVLLDFGLVTELDLRAHSHFSENMIAGTLFYMAPEQKAGGPLTLAADWYSVGVMLYEAFTGRHPFTGGPPDNGERPIPPRDSLPEMPDDLNALILQLLEAAPERRPNGKAVIHRLGGSPVGNLLPGAAANPAPLFVGREAQLESLGEALQAVKDRHTVIVFVHGPSGMGKTTLMHRFLEEQARNDTAIALVGRCYERELVAYKALDTVVDALTLVLRGLPALEVAELLPRDVPALVRLFPVLRRVHTIDWSAKRLENIPDGRELRRRAIGALRELFVRMADRRPLLVFIDDLQWGDADSAILLEELLKPPNPPALGLIATFRDEYVEKSICLQSLLVMRDRLAKDPQRTVWCRDLEIGPLTSTEAMMLALRATEDESSEGKARARAIAMESEGSPYFVRTLIESLRHPEERGSSELHSGITLDDVLWEKISRLSEPARRILEIVAVSSRPLKRSLAFAAADVALDSPTIYPSLRAGHLVSSSGPDPDDEIEIFHDRIRETVLHHLSPETLRDYHLQLAQTLRATKEAEPELLAVHYHGGGNLEEAGKYYAQAGERATTALAFANAAKLFRLALECLPETDAGRVELRIKLADSLANAGRGAEAAREYRDAAFFTGSRQALELRRKAAMQFLISGHIDEGMSLLGTVLEAVGTRIAPTPRRALLSLLFQRSRLYLRGTGFRERDPERPSPREMALERIDICWSVTVGLSIVDTIRAADFQTRTLLLALREGEPSRVARALAWEVAHLANGGGHTKRRTEKMLRSAMKLAARIEDPYVNGITVLTAGIVDYMNGRWRSCIEHSTRAEELFRTGCTGVAWERDTANSFALWSLFFYGKLGELLGRYPLLREDARERGDLYAATNLATFSGYLTWLAADDADGARDHLNEVMGKWSHSGFHVQHLTGLMAQTLIDLYCGEPQVAWDRLSSQWPRMKEAMFLRVQVVNLFMLSLRARCALEIVERAPEKSHLIRSIERDADCISGAKMPWAAPLAMVIRAALVARHGEQGRALSLLENAEMMFESADMLLFAAATRRTLGLAMGDSEGETLVTHADAWMRNEGIFNPARMARMLVPKIDSR